MLKDLERKINEIDAEIAQLEETPSEISALQIEQLLKNRAAFLDSYPPLSPHDKVFLARHEKRPTTKDYIHALFDAFFECKGDRFYGEDASILGGIALFHGIPVTVLGHQKGRGIDENIEYRFGMPNPEGYRKAYRLMEQAEKFGRPIITFIDTPGAFPGIDAEERGQSEAIAQNLALMSRLSVPIISIVTGEGGSGGALALGVADKVLMLENAIYSILSPEGFATILWKDGSRSEEASHLMKLTAQDLSTFSIIDKIIAEPQGGAHQNPEMMYETVDKEICETLSDLLHVNSKKLVQNRYDKYRSIGLRVGQ